MKVEIKIPAMGESITEVSIGRLLKESGSHVKENEEIVEIETEKVNQALYAPTSGEISWSVSEGDTLSIGSVIGFVDSEKKAEEEKPSPPPQKRESTEGIRKKPEEFIQDLETPHVEKKEEVQKDRRESRTAMSRIRKVIATRLVDALHSAAMLTTFNEVDMSAIIALRTKYKEPFLKKHEVKLGFMSFFVKAVVEALKRFPDLNSYVEGEEIVKRHYYDIGIAVGTERGLVVPVVRNCDLLSFAQIEQEILHFAQRARSGQLRIEDLEGGGFTITNGGIYGSLLSTPILNPPQVGILGMHAILHRPMAIQEKIEIRPMMYLALSYDHRVVDGKEAVSFLVTIKEILEDPSRLLFYV